jgi:hypothetical protein
MSQKRHEDAHPASVESGCGGHDSELIDTAAAADLLGVGKRQVQRLVATDKLLGVRLGSIWV